jgi:DNA-binding NtrC family response regulator
METNLNLKIFLVDDDVFCLNLYRKHLENLGYTEIYSFENGLDCIGRLTEKPEVIFLDYEMSSLTGTEVLKKIKRFDPDIFVVFLSGQKNIIPAVNALKYGAFDYIVKDDHQFENMTKVILKIIQVQELMKHRIPNIISKIFSLF